MGTVSFRFYDTISMAYAFLRELVVSFIFDVRGRSTDRSQLRILLTVLLHILCSG